jgi:hypothetical protein
MVIRGSMVFLFSAVSYREGIEITILLVEKKAIYKRKDIFPELRC